VSDFAAFGRQSSNPALVDPYTINPKFSYTRQHGAHTLKFGYEYVALSMGLADEYPLYGDDTYSGKYSAAGGADQSTAALTTEANEAWYLADFLQGLRSKYQLSGNQVFNYQQRFHYFYGQDDWKVNDRLTLNLGLRYELVTPPWVDGNQLANFSPTTNTLINASSGSLYNRSLIDIQSGNLAPRFGFAYSANRFVVLRGGYGISYVQGNRNGAEGTLAYNTVPNNVISQTTPSATNPACPAGSNSTACFRTTMEGYPSNFLTTQLNTATSIAEIRYVPKDDPTGYVQSYQLGFQAAITSNTLLDTAYVGSHGVHLRVLTDYNQAVANPGGSSTACPAPATGATPCATLSSRRPIQSFDSIIEPLGAGFLNYDSLEVKLQHRSHFGIYLLNSFTWSKAYDDAGAQYEVNNGDGALVNKYDMASERGVSGYNQPFNNTTSFVWDLPRLRVSGLWSARPSKLLLDGWQLVGINIVTSGVPVNLTYSPSSSQEVTDASVSYSYRPNIVGNVSAVINPRSQWVRSSTAISNVYSSSNLSTPTATPFGNVQRNALIGPAYGNFDFGAHKNFALWWEGSSLQFRVEAFNLFNATNYKSPDGNISSTSFGSFTSTGVFPSRRMQFALRLAF
jgi:hypothetical protein